MLVRFISIKIKILLIALAIFCLISLSGLVWVMQEPRSFVWLKGFLEEQLSKASEEFDVKIAEGHIAWDSYNHSLGFRLNDVKIVNQGNQQLVANFTEVTLGISLLSLLSGDFSFDEANVIEPSFHLTLINVDASQDKPTKEWLKSLSPFFSFLVTKENFGHSGLPKLLRVTHGKIHINNGVHLLSWQIPQAYLIANNKEIQGEFTVDFGNTSSVFSLESKKYKVDLKPEVTIKTENFPSYILPDLIPDVEQLQKIDVVLSAQMTIGMDSAHEPDVASIKITNAEGNIHLKEYFPDTLSLKSLNAEAIYELNEKLLTINALEINFPDVTFKGSGMLQNLATWSDPDLVMDTELNIHNVKTDLLQLYWPIPLGVEARTWVASNLRDGIVTHAKGRFVIKEGEYHAPSIPTHMIDATVHFKDTTVSLPSPLNRAVGARGKAFFDGDHMRVDVTQANYANSVIKNAVVAIPDWASEPYLSLTVEGNVEGPASDLMEIAAAYDEEFGAPSKAKKEEQAFSLHKINEVKGLGKTSVDISLPLKEGLTLNDMKLNIKSNLSGFSAHNVFYQKKANDMSATVNISKNDVHVSGHGKLGETRLSSFTLTLPFDDNKPSLYTIDASADVKEVESYLTHTFEHLKGDIAIKAEGEFSKENLTAKGSLNTEKTNIHFPQIGLEKESGTALTVNFTANYSEKDGVRISDIASNDPALTLNGSAYFNPQKTLETLSLSKLHYNKNQLSEVKYINHKQEQKLTLKGKQFDLNDIALGELTDSHNQESDTGSFNLNANIENMFYKNDSHFKKVEAILGCAQGKCKTIDIYAKFANDNYVVANLKPTGNKHTLMIESDNAGAFIKAVDISKDVHEGRLTIQAVVDFQNSLTEANGVMTIDHFTAKNTPILGKLLTLASFKGIGDLLKGKGIKFDKFEAPFVYQNGIITVNDAKSSGSSVGITATGNIDNNLKQMNLKGTVIPAQGVNNLVNNIPVVGNIITAGGKYGVIAANYSIKGPFSDVKASVNPLSIITPGVMNKIFDIFPDSAPKPSTKDKEKKAEENSPSTTEDNKELAE